MLKNFWRDENGGQVVEWPLIAALLGIAVIAAWGALKDNLNPALGSIGTAITKKTGEILSS